MSGIEKVFLGIATFITISASASEFPRLVIKMADNSEIVLPSESLEINYSNGNLLFTSPQLERTIPVNDIYSMKLDTAQTGVETIDETRGESFEIYTLSGISLGIFDSLESIKDKFPCGIYVVKSGECSFKLVM